MKVVVVLISIDFKNTSIKTMFTNTFLYLDYINLKCLYIFENYSKYTYMQDILLIQSKGNTQRGYRFKDPCKKNGLQVGREVRKV